ncbi:MAG TPA: hypothetical protein VHP11_07485 [Tepidisphaeraceae bacterium]|nr:hypothetical protein [Tepidisphaeraceae bacterium]
MIERPSAPQKLASDAAKRAQAELDRALFWANLANHAADQARAYLAKADKHAVILASVLALDSENQGA